MNREQAIDKIVKFLKERDDIRIDKARCQVRGIATIRIENVNYRVEAEKLLDSAIYQNAIDTIVGGLK